MLEPAVTLSDFALALECLVFAMLVKQRRTASTLLSNLYALLFASTAVAAFVGALVHGWFPTEGTSVYDILWPVSMLAVGASGVFLWLLGILLLDGRRHMQLAIRVLGALFVGYALIVIFINQRFMVALAAYLPGALFLSAVFIRRHLAGRHGSDRWGVIGIGLTLIAGAVQYFGIAPHPRFFDHNALYHTISAIGLLALYLAARTAPPTR